MDCISDVEFVKKIPQHPHDRLKRKIKRKIIKKKKRKNKKSKQKENIRNTIRLVFDDFENKKDKKKLKRK